MGQLPHANRQTLEDHAVRRIIAAILLVEGAFLLASLFLL